MRLADRCYICGSKDCDGTCPDPAAAVPEAQDGREWEPPFWCGRAETHEPHAYYRLDAKMACYGYPTESAPSAAVREGERERLAAAVRELKGWQGGELVRRSAVLDIIREGRL